MGADLDDKDAVEKHEIKVKLIGLLTVMGQDLHLFLYHFSAMVHGCLFGATLSSTGIIGNRLDPACHTRGRPRSWLGGEGMGRILQGDPGLAAVGFAAGDKGFGSAASGASSAELVGEAADHEDLPARGTCERGIVFRPVVRRTREFFLGHHRLWEYPGPRLETKLSQKPGTVTSKRSLSIVRAPTPARNEWQTGPR